MEVLSADGFLFNLVLSIWFIFNPAKASRARRNDAANIALSQNPSKSIQEAVLREAQYGARKTIGGYVTEALLSGDTRSRAERQIRHHLQAVLADLGVLVQPSSGVLVEALTPPETLAHVQKATYERRKTIELLEQHPETALQTYLIETLTQQNNLMVFNNRGVGQYLLENLYNAAFTKQDSFPAHLNYQPEETIVFTNATARSNGTLKKEVIS